MAVIGSRANGTRVPDDALKGGRFGAALFESAGSAPASDRRDVTLLGRSVFGRIGSGGEPGSAIQGAAPLDARSSLFVASTLDRVRRQWFDKLDESEAALDPEAASGFAGDITRQFDDFSARTLADMPEALRPHLNDGLARVGDELGIRARDFETLATRVGAFNQAKQALDDLTDIVRHDRFDVPRIIAEGRARIADAPVSAGARRILEDYFLADLPLKVAHAHIDDDPEDALAVIEQAGRGNATTATQDAPAGAGPPVDGSALHEPGAASLETASPAELYRSLAPEVLGRFATQAQIKAATRRQAERLGTIRRLQQGIAENRITAADIAASGLDDSDQARLIATLETAEADERRTAEAVERFTTDPESFDPEDGQDRQQIARAYSALADMGGVNKVSIAEDVFRRTGILPEPAVSDLKLIGETGSGEDAANAAALLEAAGVPSSTSTANESPEEVAASNDPGGRRDDFQNSDDPGEFGLNGDTSSVGLLEQYPFLAGQPESVRKIAQQLIDDLIAADAGAAEIRTFLDAAEAEIKRRSETAAIPLALAAGIGAVALIAAIDEWRRNDGPRRSTAALRSAFANARGNLEAVRRKFSNSVAGSDDDADDGPHRSRDASPVAPAAELDEIKRSIEAVKTELERVDAKARDNPTENVAVFRIEGERNRRLEINGNGTVRIIGGNRAVLWIHLGDKRRALEFLEKRLLGDKPLPDAQLKAFEIPKAFADQIERQAITEAQVKAKRDAGDDSWKTRPIRGDLTKTDRAFGLRAPHIESLKRNIIQGTGKVIGP